MFTFQGGTNHARYCSRVLFTRVHYSWLGLKLKLSQKESLNLNRHLVWAIGARPCVFCSWGQILCMGLGISFPTSQRTPQSDFVCKSYGLFITGLLGCPEPNPNWILSWFRIWFRLGLWEVRIGLGNLIQNLSFKFLGFSPFPFLAAWASSPLLSACVALLHDFVPGSNSRRCIILWDDRITTVLLHVSWPLAFAAAL